MKKIALLLALTLSSTVFFAGCGYTNSTETTADVEGEDLVGTTWVLTNFDMKPPVKPSDDGSLEASGEDSGEASGEVSPESGPKPPSSEEIAEYMNVSLEFKEDGKVAFASSNGSREMSYSGNNDKEDGNTYVSITGEGQNALTGVVEDGTMSFDIFGISATFTEQ